ncbi:MAG: ribosomal protein S18-alanine N-acetyltransferase [Nitrospiraceae bacterium]|nr:ribosomal protein S18-alanine N-acetyltransferase [Nitrospiraceae bacterium]
MGKTAAITIDRMVTEDLDQVLVIENASFTMPWSRNLFLSEFRNKPVSLMLVALAEGAAREVMGYVVCWVFVDELHVLDLATRPDVRRSGIARQLVIAALAMGYSWGARKAFLEVRESNRPAFKLYASLGFAQTQIREEYYDQPIENAVVMMLSTDRFRALLSASVEGWKM